MNKPWWEKRLFNLPFHKRQFLKSQPLYKRPLYYMGYFIEGLQSILYFPIVLTIITFKKIIWIGKNIPYLVKELIIMVYLWLDKIIFLHKVLRKLLFKILVKRNVLAIIICYFILSLFDELTYWTDHSLATFNDYWIITFNTGFDYYLYAFLIYNIIWIWSLYFIELNYFFKNNWEVFLWIIFCSIDMATPYTSYLTIECFIVYLELTCYLTTGLVFVWMDEDSGDQAIIQGSDDSGNHGINLKELEDDTFPERKMWKSWQRDYFFYLMQNTEDVVLKKNYEKNYKLWVDHDVEIYEEYVF